MKKVLKNNGKSLKLTALGFTLIELLAVIIILAVIALITFPVIDDVIKNSREEAYNRTVDSIIEAAKNYSVTNNLGYSQDKQPLYLEDIKAIGLLEKSIINPITDEEMTGCVWYYWNSTYNQYEFEYDSACVKVETEPTINIAYNENLINNNGWAKENIAVTLSGNGEIKYCLGSSECTPNEIVETGNNTKFITTEGTTYICAVTTNSLGSSDTLCESFKLDKTAPTAGTATFSGTVGSNSWYTTNVTVNKVNGSDALSGHSSTTSNISSITSNTTGQTVTITTTDLAGNSSTRDYIIKVDKNAPTLAAKSGTVTIKEGESNAVSNYFTVSYSISGGSISCSPTNTSSLSTGTRSVSCTATGGNGLATTTSKQITVNKKITYPTIAVDTSGANSPKLASNMIPVVYSEIDDEWIYADTSKSWYNYNEKLWANAVVLNSGVSKNVGDTITENEIVLWYVWIPRYKYQLFNANNGSVSEQLINIEFESGTASTGTVSCTDAVSGSGSSSETCTNASNGNWYTHPAFTFGEEEITGFWVGKFEVSGSTSQITIKPNVSSLRSQTVSSFFTAIQNMSTTYSLSGDSHMMKNMEWGAVAYLKQSKYGLGLTDIGINNNSSYITGCGATAGSEETRTCEAYNTTNGMLASTTGNIYGLYDMSGGAWEYVMGNIVNSSGAFDASHSGFSSAPDAKYYDAYTYGTTNIDHGRGKLGDATKETLATYGIANGGWYSDYTDFPLQISSWFERGGYCNGVHANGAYAGVFTFSYSGGGSDGYGYDSARGVLVP